VQLSFVAFFQYILKFFIFFGIPMAQKKIREPFFLSKSKVQKSKSLYINYFYQNLKFIKIESQIHRKKPYRRDTQKGTILHQAPQITLF